MAASERVGVFLCRGGKTQTDALDFRRLRWTAEAGVGGANVHEITQACQAEGAAQVARVVRDSGLTSFVVGACPLAVPAAPGGPLPEGMELETGNGIWLDLCRKPDGEALGCVVHPGAATALGQALAVQAYRPTPSVETLTVPTDVLVVGDGLAALSAARGLVRAGYGVVLVAPTKRLAPPEPLWGPEAGQEAAALAGEI
ncbi:MAG: hypothetical protein KJ621_04520 [Proteobacteria bacterium]|nr:hypothetical protein [Pseudomonadota bacterium]MBU1742667.1 hypothetical protein [Pseudomonadota bacterium]